MYKNGEKMVFSRYYVETCGACYPEGNGCCFCNYGMVTITYNEVLKEEEEKERKERIRKIEKSIGRSRKDE